jgi:hypothetical protein
MLNFTKKLSPGIWHWLFDGATLLRPLYDSLTSRSFGELEKPVLCTPYSHTATNSNMLDEQEVGSCNAEAAGNGCFTS